MSAHTPGPWEVRKDQWDGYCVHAPSIEEKIDGGSYCIVTNVNGDKRDDPMYGIPEANARLIAAAPELLEACLLARHICEPGNALQKQIDAAIAKATGGAK